MDDDFKNYLVNFLLDDKSAVNLQVTFAHFLQFSLVRLRLICVAHGTISTTNIFVDPKKILYSHLVSEITLHPLLQHHRSSHPLHHAPVITKDGACVSVPVALQGTGVHRKTDATRLMKVRNRCKSVTYPRMIVMRVCMYAYILRNVMLVILIDDRCVIKYSAQAFPKFLRLILFVSQVQSVGLQIVQEVSWMLSFIISISMSLSSHNHYDYCHS